MKYFLLLFEITKHMNKFLSEKTTGSAGSKDLATLLWSPQLRSPRWASTI